MSRKEKRQNARNKEIIVLVTVLIITILVALALLIYKKVLNNNTNNVEEPNEVIALETEEVSHAEEYEEKIEIFSGNDRPIAVMIDNHKDAWPQAAINSAYCVYEIIVEGGETRLMALFKGADLEQIGPVRSARHYFLDYALENDAIYTHYGWSPQAQSDIPSLKVNNINGITESTANFKRIKGKSSPHNVMTSTASLKKIAENKKYRTTSDATSVLNYVEREVELNSETIANEVTIPYSTLHKVTYKYDAETKRYTRYARGKKQTDYNTKEDITTKNIIITFAENYKLNDGENKDRQGLKNTGTKEGYYITNGKAIKITCQKSSRTAKTVYKDLEGNVIDVNDGNTFINICPIDAKVAFE